MEYFLREDQVTSPQKLQVLNQVKQEVSSQLPIKLEEIEQLNLCFDQIDYFIQIFKLIYMNDEKKLNDIQRIFLQLKQQTNLNKKSRTTDEIFFQIKQVNEQSLSNHQNENKEINIVSKKKNIMIRGNQLMNFKKLRQSTQYEFRCKLLQFQNRKNSEIQNREIENKLEELEEIREIFIDKDFPPKIESISEDAVAYINKNLYESNIELCFKRVSEVIKNNPVNLFYNDTTSIHDVSQGLLGNCYLISCLVVLSQYPDIVKSLFKNKSYSQSGKYTIKLIKNGIPIEVVVDDHLPCYPDSRGFAFASSPNQNSIWVSLLEKSLAKIHKSYLNIEGNNKEGPGTDGVFIHLLGCPSDQYNIKSGELNSFKDINESWEQIYGNYNKGYLQTTSVSSKETQKKTLDNGLVTNHAYSILEVRKIDNLKLIKIKNPWAKTEWKLDWSDQSPKWTKFLKNEVSLEVKDDGVFWMSFEDFYKHFGCVNVAFFNPNYKYSYLEIKNQDQFAYFTYNLSLENEEKDIEGYLLLNQTSERFLNSQQGIPFKKSSISFCIFEMNEDNKKPISIIVSKCQNQDTIYTDIRFKQDFLTSQSKNFVLSLYANKQVHLKQSQIVRSNLKTLIDYIDNIELSEFEDYDKKQAYYIKKRFGSLLIFAIRNEKKNQSLQTDLQITNNDVQLVRESLKYNIDSFYQETQNNTFKIILPAGKNFKLIFKQSSYSCLWQGLGFSCINSSKQESYLTDQQIEEQISKEQKQNLVSQYLKGEIYKQVLQFDAGYVIKKTNTTKDKTYVQEIRFNTINLKFINSHQFEMNQHKYYKIKIPPQSSIILKFEKINYNSEYNMSWSYYSYQLI